MSRKENCHREDEEESPACHVVTQHLQDLGESQPPSKDFPLPSHFVTKRTTDHAEVQCSVETTPTPHLGHHGPPSQIERDKALCDARKPQASLKGTKLQDLPSAGSTQERPTISTRMTKAKTAPIDHFHRHHHTLQETKHAPTETPSDHRGSMAPRQRPQGGNNIEDAVVVLFDPVKDLKLSPRAHHRTGYESFTMTPSSREAAPEGVTNIVADKVSTRLSPEASHPGLPAARGPLSPAIT